MMGCLSKVSQKCIINEQFNFNKHNMFFKLIAKKQVIAKKKKKLGGWVALDASTPSKSASAKKMENKKYRLHFLQMSKTKNQERLRSLPNWFQNL